MAQLKIGNLEKITAEDVAKKNLFPINSPTFISGMLDPIMNVYVPIENLIPLLEVEEIIAYDYGLPINDRKTLNSRANHYLIFPVQFYK